MNKKKIIKKNQIDKWYSDNYKWLLEISKSHIFLNRRKIDPNDLVSNAYLYVLSKQNIIEDEQMLETFSARFIMMESYWWNSKSNKETPKGFDQEEEFDLIDEDDDIDYKIEYEKWYNNSKCKLEEYRQTISKKEDLIFFDVYWNYASKNIVPTVRRMAKHFGISPTSTHTLITEMRKNLNNFILNNN